MFFCEAVLVGRVILCNPYDLWIKPYEAVLVGRVNPSYSIGSNHTRHELIPACMTSLVFHCGLEKYEIRLYFRHTHTLPHRDTYSPSLSGGTIVYSASGFDYQTTTTSPTARHSHRNTAIISSIFHTSLYSSPVP
jgi:hypothetical protein